MGVCVCEGAGGEECVCVWGGGGKFSVLSYILNKSEIATHVL